MILMKRYEDITKQHDYDYLCIPHQQLTNYLHVRMFGLQEGFEKKILAEGGVEQDHHITLLFGIIHSTENFELLQSRLKQASLGAFSCEIGSIAKFESEDYDVFYYEIKSPELEKAYAVTRSVVDITSESFQKEDYKPHMTIAFVKKGKAEELLGPNSLTGYSFVVGEFQFTDIYDRKKRMHL